ncbi:membrane traffic protein [Lithospermum erythrorhizon]|uniref:Exocyst subunit Exo70 family protein n=1 Tax=Lithospermum erythrorhizon TaxID=34254 RepID=A0AAV3QW48_LITER
MRTGLFSSPKHSSPARSEATSTSSSYPSSPYRARNTFSEQMMAENIDNAGVIITTWEFQGDATNANFTSMFREYPDEAKKQLGAIKNLQKTMHYLVKHDSSSELLTKAQSLMDMSMRRLEKEFHFILSRNRNILDLESDSNQSSNVSSARTSVSDDVGSTDNDGEIEVENKLPNESIMDDLKKIAECMIASGYGKECITIYKLVRKSILDESLYNLGVLEKNITSSQIQKLDWDNIELKIKTWLRGIKIAMKDIFLGERILCDYVFSSSEKVIESCFVEIAKDRALALLIFPEVVAKYKKLSAEKMFRILDMYEAISTLQTEIEVIFAFNSSSVVRSQAVKSLERLGEAVRSMWSEFESAIQKDTSKAVPGGGIHPLTRYVMNYLIFVADYSSPLEDIMADWPLVVKSPLPEMYFPARTSPSSSVYDGEEGGEDSALAIRVAWLIFLVLCKLDAKAELYKDVALAYLFLANNLNYVVTKIKKSNLSTILGSEWIFKNEAKVKEYTSNYERIGWKKVITSFPEQPTSEMTQEYVMECFRKFNSGFEEAYRIQSTWVIPDQKIKEQVKLSLARKIIPAYREFYDSYRGKWRSKFGEEPIIRFSPEDLFNFISDLFQGDGGSSGSTTTITLR